MPPTPSRPAPRLAALLLLVASACASPDDHGAPGSQALDATSLGDDDRTAIPLREVSALALRSYGGHDELLALSDRSFAVASARLTADVDDLDFEVHDLKAPIDAAGLARGEASQWEAMASDGEGRVLVLEENPGRILVFSPELDTLERVVEFDATGSEGADSDAWAEEENSRGEGLVLSRDGHVLLLKEKRPRLILELGPAGDAPLGLAPLAPGARFELPAAGTKLVALARYELPADSESALPDLSELTLGRDGRLYVLSDEGRSIARIESLDQGAAVLGPQWTIGRDAKAEGLVVLEGSVPLVAFDRPDIGKNLASYAPLR